jgi:hypothetical protein
VIWPLLAVVNEAPVLLKFTLVTRANPLALTAPFAPTATASATATTTAAITNSARLTTPPSSPRVPTGVVGPA